jgi:TonB family protein
LRKKHLEGTVTLEFVVKTDGHTEKIKVIQGPSPELIEIAVRAVEGWLYKPGVDPDGNPVEFSTQVQMSFDLKK